MSAPNEKEECCPRFYPEKWEKVEHHWDHKPFIMDSMTTFFHIPFPPAIGKKIRKMDQLKTQAGQIEEDKAAALVLFRDPTAFRSEIYLSVKGQVKDANNVPLTGTFISRAFTGSYNAVPKNIKEMDAYLSAQGKKAKDYFIHYAYCPECAKKFGNNYMILFARI